MTDRRIAVIGGGITGLAATFELVNASRCSVTLFEAGNRCGGRIASSVFAGVHGVDTGADAFLTRVPDAVDLAREVGLAAELVSPQPVGAAVWYDGLHPIPDALLLGVPSRIRPLVTTRLLTWQGKARAAVEPFLPRTPIDDDSIGSLIRARFGNEVNERLVDALIGSIYATDTDRFSLREVPQLHDLATRDRSLLLGARRTIGATSGTATGRTSPIFASPRGGLAQLVDASVAAIEAGGATIRTGTSADRIEPDGAAWRVDDDRFDAIIVALPASSARLILQSTAPDAATLLARAETADVAMVILHVATPEWPDQAVGMSGYLVPKPVQRTITAVSFGSQKWHHWRPPAGGEIVRASIGRDGSPIPSVSDDDMVSRVLDDLDLHLGTRFAPIEASVTRWPGAFAQYRPHHRRWAEAVERSLPAGLFVAGSSYRGIGIPACIRDGRAVARRADMAINGLQD